MVPPLLDSSSVTLVQIVSPVEVSKFVLDCFVSAVIFSSHMVWCHMTMERYSRDCPDGCACKGTRYLDIRVSSDRLLLTSGVVSASLAVRLGVSSLGCQAIHDRRLW